ncbi:MAG: hypothetical protein AB1430_22380 [Pseudomonadota bacterium]
MASRKARRFPTSLNGGEDQDPADHRVGETTRHNPQIGEVDPAEGERDLERDERETATGEDPR